jgi:iron(II)-dependent oxidoreductase
MTVAFVLASYAANAPAGMERATAALAHGLRRLGHRALVLTAASPTAQDCNVLRLDSVGVSFPCDDPELRAAITRHGQDLIIGNDLRGIYREHAVNVAVYVDALWGLGRVAPTNGVRSVLAMHVVGHDEDLQPALERADRVIAPSRTVLHQAANRGYDITSWHVVPNGLLHDRTPPPSEEQREALRAYGPIRVLARLGTEKNIQALLTAGRLVERPIDVTLSAASFESAEGTQADEWQRCSHSAGHLKLGTIRGDGLDWAQVQPWLAEAAVVIVPSLRETFGLVALEAMSVGTPVVAYAVDNLPALIGTGKGAGGLLVARSGGEHELWHVAQELLADPARYSELSRAAHLRSRDYLPARVAEKFVKAVQ